MRSFALVALSSLLTLTAASPDHFQSVASVLCTDGPAQTVTVTQACAPGQTIVSGGQGSDQTVTVTETASTVTVTKTVIVETSNTDQATTAASATITIDATTTSSASGSVTTHKVLVGAFKDGNQTDFLFKPNNITAKVGDVVVFDMLGASHSVTQSQFPAPCTKNGTFDTELRPNAGNVSGFDPQTFIVRDTNPKWFYCKQTNKINHCGKGMVFGINPKSQDQMAQFVSNAIAQNGHFNTNATATTTVTSTMSTVTSISAAVITVEVGLDAGKTLQFKPDHLEAVAVGTTIKFDFRAKNHTLTESSFDSPCSKLAADAKDTGFTNFNPNDLADQFTTEVRVTSETARYFYCKQRKTKNHCGSGMIFAINVGQGRFNQFQAKADATLVTVPAIPKIKGRTPRIF